MLMLAVYRRAQLMTAIGAITLTTRTMKLTRSYLSLASVQRRVSLVAIPDRGGGGGALTGDDVLSACFKVTADDTI